MDVSLPDELVAYVDSKIATGLYSSSSDVVGEALLLMAMAESKESAIVRLREAWAAGKASGLYGEIDFEALRAEGRRRLASSNNSS